jgi:5-methylcytosine-specific restriction endonuclease McrA
LKPVAEVHGNRTHRPTRRRTTGFEVQEAHQDLSTSRTIIARNRLKCQYLGEKPEDGSQKTGDRKKDKGQRIKEKDGGRGSVFREKGKG